MSNYTTKPKANAHPRTPSLIAPLWICVGFEQQRRECTHDTEYQVWQHRLQSILMSFPEPAAHRAGQYPAVPGCPLLEHPTRPPDKTISCYPSPVLAPPAGAPHPLSLCLQLCSHGLLDTLAQLCCQIYLGFGAGNAVVRLAEPNSSGLVHWDSPNGLGWKGH